MELLKNKTFLAKGKRSNVYLADWKGREVVVKEKSPDSDAIMRMENEAYWLKQLNKVGIGPRLYFSGEDFVVMDYIDGERILDWAKKHANKDIKLVLIEVLRQCRQLDGIQVSKEEMHHPLKHVLVSKGKVVMIDFERCHRVKSPQNVTQFAQFIVSRGLMPVLKDDLVDALKEYKTDYSDRSFRKVLRALSL